VVLLLGKGVLDGVIPADLFTLQASAYLASG
jgi:hypothetical protein